MSLHRARATLGLGAAVLAFAVAGCSGDAGPARRAATAPHHRHSARPVADAGSPSPSPSKTESSSPEDSASGEDALPADESPVPDPPLEARLLTAAEMPGFNDHFTWREAGTRSQEGSEPFGTCHQHLMTSIGAMRVAVREFRPTQAAPDDTASSLVAEFPDTQTAKRAFEVLKSWRAQCQSRLSSYDQSDVSQLQPVSAAGADAGWYLLRYGPPSGGSPDEAYFDAQGITRVGRKVAVVQLRLLGQDYNYPTGHEPMVGAVRTASSKLS